LSSGEESPTLFCAKDGPPALNGLESAREIRRLAPHVKIVIFTMHDSTQMTELARKAGADVVVDKFAAEKELVQAIRQFRK